MAQIDQALQSLAVGQEVIKQQHMVALVEIPLGHDDGEFLLLGEGVDGGGVLVAIEIDGLRLLGEHHRRIAEMTRGNAQAAPMWSNNSTSHWWLRKASTFSTLPGLTVPCRRMRSSSSFMNPLRLLAA